MGYQIICIFFNHSSGTQIGYVKLTGLRTPFFFSIVEKGERRFDVALDLCSGWGRVHYHRESQSFQFLFDCSHVAYQKICKYKCELAHILVVPHTYPVIPG